MKLYVFFYNFLEKKSYACRFLFFKTAMALNRKTITTSIIKATKNHPILKDPVTSKMNPNKGGPMITPHEPTVILNPVASPD